MADCFAYGRKSPKKGASDQLPSYYGLNNKYGYIVVAFYGDYHKSIVASKEEWQELIEQQKASGMPPKAWCAENGINYYTYSDRKSRLNKIKEKATKTDLPQAKQAKFAKVTVENKPKASEQSEIQVKIGSFTIIVQSDFKEETLLKACKAVMSLC